MKRNRKRLPAFLLAVMLCLSLLPVTAGALEISGEGWEFDLTDMSKPTLVIKSNEGMTDWIANGGSYRGIVLAVNLNEGITKIPYHAFYKCNQLTTVEIPASVTEMGKNDVFEGCSKLESITVAAGNKNFTAVDGILYSEDKTDVLICPPGKSGDVTLPNTVTRIAGSAFKGCAKLTGVTLHEGISSIENVVFDGCNGLTTLTLPASLTSLGNGAFDNCAGLTSLNVADGNSNFSSENGVLYNKAKTELLLYPMAKSDTDFTIPDSVTSIADNAFKGARYLQTVTAGDLTSIESSAFMNCESLTSFSAKSLGEVKLQAFYQCANLETFTLEDENSLKTIGNNAFSRCSSLTAAPLAGATSIGNGAFQNCMALTSLTFCETGSVTIGTSAFPSCTGLTELTFPTSIQSIGGSAFGGCNKVTVITFKSATPPDCGYNIFSIGDPNEFQIVVPSGSEGSYQTALGDTLGSYVGDTLVKKYPLFVNGQQFTSETTTITCGAGTATFDVNSSTLTLTNATIDTMGGNYGYGGAINSGLAELTIKLVGTNTIHAEQQDYWGTTYRDSINSGANCDVKIVSGESNGTMPTLVCDLIDMGRGGSGFTGGAGEGNLTVDGVNLTVNDRIFVHHNTTFQNGAQVNVTGGLTVNNSATVTVTGDATAVTVKFIALGNSLPGQTNRLVLDSGTLTLTGSVAYPGATDGDTNPYAIHFDPVSSGSIAINGGMFVKQASCAGTNIDESKITQAENLPVQGSWESGTLIIGPASDDKYTVTVKSDPAEGGVAYGGGRYADNEKATLTVTAQTGWFFIGWYRDSGTSAVSTSKSYEYTVEKANVTFTAKFIEDKLYQAEQAKGAFNEAQKEGNLTWTILTDALNAYNAVPDFLTQIKDINGLLTDEEKTALDNRYSILTTYYQDITTLNLSNQGISSADLAKLALFTGVTDLNLSGNKGVTSLSNLTRMTQLETLDLSGTGVTDLSSLSSLTKLETLDISGTGVTTLDSLVPEDSSTFPGSKTLTAKNLSLASISALANLVSAEGFSTETVTKWDFTGSTLPGTEENKADVKAIQTALDDKFLPPTVPDNTYTISASPATLDFGSVYPNYTQPAAQTVTIKNTGNQTVTLVQPTSEHYILGELSAKELAPNGTATFTVQPKPGLDVNTYNEALTVTGSSGDKTVQATVQLQFEVKQQTGGGGGGGGVATYTVTVGNAEHGKVTASPTRAGSGSTVTLTVKPDQGYALDTLTATDAKGNEVKLTDKGNGTYTFTMPASKVKIAASFKESAEQVTHPFTDVFEGDYYYDAVLWAVEQGVTNGTSATTFSPNVTVTRAQMVTFLWRAHGAPAAAGSNPFADVSRDAYYYDAVLWAAANGVTNGTSAAAFSPDAPVTRAQAVTFQWRAHGAPEAAGDSFGDVPADAYYSQAVAWAAANGITNGTGADTFSPEAAVSRAQAVTFLWRELA